MKYFFLFRGKLQPLSGGGSVSDAVTADMLQSNSSDDDATLVDNGVVEAGGEGDISGDGGASPNVQRGDRDETTEGNGDDEEAAGGDGAEGGEEGGRNGGGEGGSVQLLQPGHQRQGQGGLDLNATPDPLPTHQPPPRPLPTLATVPPAAPSCSDLVMGLARRSSSYACRIRRSIQNGGLAGHLMHAVLVLQLSVCLVRKESRVDKSRVRRPFDSTS